MFRGKSVVRTSLLKTRIGYENIFLPSAFLPLGLAFYISALRGNMLNVSKQTVMKIKVHKQSVIQPEVKN